MGRERQSKGREGGKERREEERENYNDRNFQSL